MQIFGKHRFDDVEPDLEADVKLERGDLMAMAFAMATYLFPIVVGFYAFFALLTWIMFY
ncbi:MAG: hypothetical protein KBF03_00745 [Proteiniclasticum sp.]|nr:hypothetical protein [Proteiniclasticum sp.]